MKKVIDKIFYTNSIKLFYILFFLSTIFFVFIKSKIFYIISVIMSCIIFGYRLINRHKKIKMLEFYSLDDEKQTNDRKMRSYQFSDCVAIVVNVILCISMDEVFMKYYGNSLIWIVVCYASIYFVSVYFSIQKNLITLKVLCVLMSTMQGLLIFLGLIIFVVIMLSVFVHGNCVNIPNLFDKSQIDSIVMWGFIFEKMPLITSVTASISIILYIVLIFGTPYYQYNKLIYAFKTAIIIFTLCSIVMFFVINIATDSIVQFAHEKGKMLLENMPNDTIDMSIYDYYKNFSKTNLSNLVYLLLLPYTFGILVSGLIIDIKKNMNVKKADKAFEVIMTHKWLEIDYYLKKYYYYGGDKSKMQMFEQINIISNKLK
ncbi:hypothetical protein JYG23_08710 [Sedimentibacter sp. zth1]|uniref:hypothetical protein n=1 Tax=Sedimentibacter sp. zth1 TaxID=2816908 RepID=UPI001A9170A4|nr:hypothetical protein [Sedimentibacter sp. zth1]QSX04787.1 hypothetical protein JYG23_08710 [Sedimentibacter sp. zth1]